MKNKFLSIKQLDQQLLALKNNGAMNMPLEGWVRSVRKGLGMTITQLAKRLGVNASRVVKIEMSEPEGAVTLRTMQGVAEQLGCVFAYQFLPKTSLEELVRQRAIAIASTSMQRTAHSMDLESQSVEKKWSNEQMKEMSDELLEKSWRYLWGD
ncbi:MAG: transcriptional regulator [Gammaproteobacteria bacterium RIFCSPHIGHO2_12_FULL_40_19]|nr:MAG: transcriptional regulator [Gammaproteobacteria bacterium RIFCSPHIGHO2_12_FULL_40_19]